MTRDPFRSMATATAALLVSSTFVIAAISPTPSQAQAIEVRVRYKDLNLAQPAGATELDRRIRRAAERVCPVFTGSRLPDGECRADVTAQLRRAIDMRLAFDHLARTGA